MYIDRFVAGEIAMHVSGLDNLDELEHAIDAAVGGHPSNGSFADGFEDYCRKQIDNVKRHSGITEIYVCLDGDGTAYSYMPAGTTYLQDELGMDIIPAEDVLDELRQITDHSDKLEADFFDLLK